MQRRFLTLLSIQLVLSVIVLGLASRNTTSNQVLGLQDSVPGVTWCLDVGNDQDNQCFDSTPILAAETAYSTFLRFSQENSIDFSSTFNTIDQKVTITSVAGHRIDPSTASWVLFVGDDLVEQDINTYIPRVDERLLLQLREI